MSGVAHNKNDELVLDVAIVDELREQLHAEGRYSWVCQCGRDMSDHSMRTRPNTGGREYVCFRRESGRFEPVTLPELNYSPEKGLHRP